jgi:predicted dithiol-disulfide oxidoreductase (DUF899 family)
MTHEFTSGTYRQTKLANESEEYLAKREELRLAEIELMEHRERVATLRRALPQGAALQDYEFLEGAGDLGAEREPIHTIKLRELFTAASRPLVIYHLMYGCRAVLKSRNRPSLFVLKSRPKLMHGKRDSVIFVPISDLPHFRCSLETVAQRQPVEHTGVASINPRTTEPEKRDRPNGL